MGTVVTDYVNYPVGESYPVAQTLENTKSRMRAIEAQRDALLAACHVGFADGMDGALLIRAAAGCINVAEDLCRAGVVARAAYYCQLADDLIAKHEAEADAIAQTEGR